jgi:hypothetical protein
MGAGGQRHESAALTPGKRPVTHCIGVWMGPRTGLDGTQGRSGWDPGPVWTGVDILASTGIRSPVASRYIPTELSRPISLSD